MPAAALACSPAAAAAAGAAIQCGSPQRLHTAPQRSVAAGAWSLLGPKHVEQPRLFVFGLGYTGLGAASYFQQRGWSVAGTCRTLDKCDRLAQRGIATYHFDPSDFDNLSGKALESLRHATHVLSTVPPDGESDMDPVIMAHGQQLSEHAEAFKWAGYISSTSVYGDYEGEWVDEGSELRAAGGKGWARVLAEHEWLALHDNFGLPVHIFRCGGIYGPQRSALEAAKRAWAGGDASPSAARRARQRYTARCHVFDICQSLEASMRHPRPGAAYNIADDDPADRATVLAYAEELLHRQAAGLPPPEPGWGLPSGHAGSGGSANGAVGGATALEELVNPISSVNTSSGSGSSGSYDSGDDLLLQLQVNHHREQQAAAAAAAGREPALAERRPRGGGASARMGGGRRGGAAGLRVLEEKRVKNARLKEELGVRLAFPTYREGLAAIAAGDMRPFEPLQQHHH